MNQLFAQTSSQEDPAVPAPDAVSAEGATPAANAKAAPVEGAAAPAAAVPAATAPATAEDATTTSTAATPWYDEMLHSGAMGYMIDGGIFMWPILLLAIFAAGAIIERFRSLKMLRGDTEALRARVLDLLHEDRVEEALALCEGEQGPVPAILSAGLRKFLILRRLGYDAGKIQEEVVKSMDDYGVHIVAALERNLPILATASSVAPMIGFLGTVQGMVVSFADIVRLKGQVDIVSAAAEGIMVALLTTVFGLIVGIPAFTAYNYFTSVINRFVLEVEESATELMEAVTLEMALGREEEGRDGEPVEPPARARPANV